MNGHTFQGRIEGHDLKPSTATAMKHTSYGFANLFRRNRLSIGTRLSACFVVIVLSMIAADVVVVWQLERMATPTQRLSAADQASLAIVRVHLDVDAFQDKATELARSHDARQFANEVASLRHTFLQDVERTEQALRESPAIEQDPTISSALETLKVALPSQLDGMLPLATAGDWNALGLRLVEHSQDPIQLSSLLVERLNQRVLQQRARAVENTQQARRQLFIAIPIAALLTLFAAAALGWYTTRTITVPLSELSGGAQALARGDFQHQVEVGGNDELTVLGKAFNYAARRLSELYEGLRRSEKQLRDVINTVPAYMWSASPDGLVDFVNQGWQEFTGLPPEGGLGRNWETLLHPDDRAKFVAEWGAALRNGQSMEGEARVLRADGEYRWWFCRNVPLRDETGNIVKWYGTGVDIADRKRAESLLAGEKRILEMVAKGDSLAEILDALCWLVGEHARGVLASILLLDGNRLRHGGGPSLPKAYTDAIDGTAIGPSAGSCGTAAYGGEQVIVEDIATDPLWVNYRHLALPHSLRACWSTPVFSSQGKVIATFAMYYREPRRPSLLDQEIIKQITYLAGVAIERNLIQEALRRSEAYLAEAQRLSHTGSWALNPTENAYWSEEAFRIWGFDPQEGPPSREAVLQRIHPGDREWVLECAQNALRERRDYTAEFRIVLPAGTVRHVQALGHPVFSASGEIVEVLGTHIDVTERKRAEEARDKLRQLEADLAHINRVTTMGELTASLAHEINQPIGSAVTNAQACLRFLNCDEPDVPEAREAALEMVRDAGRAVDIIERVRSLYRKDSPQQQMVDVNEVIREMVVMLHKEANRYSVNMHTELCKDLPNVVADRVQLQQVLMNLMMNGIEAMRDAGGDLSIKSGLADDGQLTISVSDRGVGLPAGKADEIFDAFFTTKPQGTGLGLAITRSIVESHGGRVWASANSGRGATFQFTLPQKTAAHA